MTSVSPTSGQMVLPQAALTSPYDGTVPTSLGTIGTTGGIAPAAVPALTGLAGTVGAAATGTPRQVNATNQTAIAPNGNVNQSVTNENSYTNKYYNIIVPNPAFGGGYGGAMGGVGLLGTLGNALGLGGVGGYGAGIGGYGVGGVGGLLGGWNSPGNSYVDPATGVMYVQKETGITGWFHRLFNGW